MDLAEIREAIKAPKQSNQFRRSNVVDFGRFAVLFAKGGEPILVDSEVAEEIKDRLWCLSAGYPATRVGDKIIRLHEYVLARNYIDRPKGCYADHVNQDKLDNRLINLRVVMPSDNSANVPLRTDNTSGVMGVTKTKHGTYRAYITKNKKRIELGHFKNFQDAVAARKTAEESLGFKTRPSRQQRIASAQSPDEEGKSYS